MAPTHRELAFQEDGPFGGGERLGDGHEVGAVFYLFGCGGHGLEELNMQAMSCCCYWIKQGKEQVLTLSLKQVALQKTNVASCHSRTWRRSAFMQPTSISLLLMGSTSNVLRRQCSKALSASAWRPSSTSMPQHFAKSCSNAAANTYAIDTVSAQFINQSNSRTQRTTLPQPEPRS